MALRALNDPDAAEEVAQESLARGLEALNSGRVREQDLLGAYFRGICRNVIVDRIRRNKRVTSLDARPEAPPQSPPSDALDVLISREQRERLRLALSKLSPRARECLRLSFYEGLKPAEIAQRLGEPGARIRKRHQRALETLREIFHERATDRRHEMTASPTSTEEAESTGAREPEDLT